MSTDINRQTSQKAMLETGRRSAISTSELGLYSDRGDRYRSRYGLIVRKFAIGVMVVVTVILVAIFMYDFTSVTSGNSKINQETKHIYILQNTLKKSSNLSKKSNSTMYEAAINRTDDLSMEDRSDDKNYEILMQQNATSDIMPVETRIVKADEPEMRAQNLHNFKQRKRMLKSVEDAKENEEPESKQLFDNHAIVYRVRQRYKYPDIDEDISAEESQPTPFHWEFKTPHPTSFKRPRYPQLTQYRYPHSSRSIQDIIKYLTNNAEMPNRGIKFTGVYMNPKKYDLIPDMGEMMSSNDKFEENEAPPIYPMKSTVHNNDPFYQYKPKHPADVNLLATSNVRFSPSGIHRYSPYYDPIYSRPLVSYNKPIVTEPQYETVDSYSTNTLGKSRKPKPFSVMLDIYPITDIMEQNKKTTWPRPQAAAIDDYDIRRPIQYRGPKFYASPPKSIPLVAMPTPTSEEEERQQMIFHLNLYPRKKNKLSRNDIIHRSELMEPEEQQEFAKKIMSPLESIAKHLTDHSAIEESRFEENQNSETTSFPLTRYHEMSLDDKNDKGRDFILNNDSGIYSNLANNNDIVRDIAVLSNHKLIIDEDYASTEKYEINTRNIIVTTGKDCANCNDTTIIDSLKANTNKSIDLSKDLSASASYVD
ncbi:uncharacterized protein LOC105421993 isoform X1 [Pogonomyrmex barbatus]|uniref:Uncharacterized protein LOC105421993 isoform X1 n=1 Tax=Pogonomyrmex barbatus TaxID=144034 RepID=A0A6I9VUV9_9HYME|nr:uncharacterized protein LOC105421993 isoform X1 [Pogonomyrmex barbatus]